jgi:hypothetical protein
MTLLLEFSSILSRSIDGSGSGAPRKVKIRGFPTGRKSFGAPQARFLEKWSSRVTSRNVSRRAEKWRKNIPSLSSL